MAADPTKRLRIATIYSYGANEAETDGILDEENPEDTSNLDQSSRDFLDAAIQDYNEMFHTNYSTDGERFLHNCSQQMRQYRLPFEEDKDL